MQEYQPDNSDLKQFLTSALQAELSTGTTRTLKVSGSRETLGWSSISIDKERSYRDQRSSCERSECEMHMFDSEGKVIVIAEKAVRITCKNPSLF